MKDELEEKLYNQYPYLYKQKDRPRDQTRLCDGFCCGDGWFKIIDELSSKLEPFQCAEVCQVKQKFGGLRFYIDFNPSPDEETRNKIYDLIYEAEERSTTICERCGEPGKIRTNGWLRTLCDACDERRHIDAKIET